MPSLPLLRSAPFSRQPRSRARFPPPLSLLPPAAGACTPYTLPDGYYDYQSYCLSLRNQTNDVYEGLFNTSTAPAEYGDTFPLNSSVLGCIVGSGSVLRANIFNVNSWSGKRFGDWNVSTQQASAVNILSDGNAMTDYTWANGLAAFTYFNGVVYSSNDSIANDGKGAWRIEYNTTLFDVINPYSILVGSTLDELRYVEKGKIIGRTWAKPGSTLNGGSDYLNEDLYFVLLQVCTQDGEYAYDPSDRYLGYTGDGGAPPPPSPPPSPPPPSPPSPGTIQVGFWNNGR